MPCSLQRSILRLANPARYGAYGSSSAGIFGAIDASGIASHLQCLVAQVRPWASMWPRRQLSQLLEVAGRTDSPIGLSSQNRTIY